jgi:hypothetical protein
MYDMYTSNSTSTLGGLGASTNDLWVQKYQNPFNATYLFPITAAVDAGTKTPAQGYVELKAAYDRIQADADAFIASFSGPLRTAAQATIDRWRASDGPLIQSFLNRWLPYMESTPAPTPSPAPVLAPPPADVSPTQLIISGRAPAPSIPGAGFMPAGPGSVVSDLYPTELGPAAPQGDFLTQLGPMLPWIAGGVLVAVLLRKRR